MSANGCATRLALVSSCLCAFAAHAHLEDADGGVLHSVGLEQNPAAAPPDDLGPSTGADAGTKSALKIAEPAYKYESVVTARRAFTAASSTTVRDRDFLLRPHPRPADILQVVPGLYTNQHAGGGKANQYFLRGFDADHGTDILLSVDGVPVNMVSHAHGQGYADLNWVIPELVKTVEVSKGPYSAHAGDFATAGAINLVTRDHFETNQVTLSGGSFATWRALAITSPTVGPLDVVLAGQVYGTHGPFDNPERLQRYSLFAKASATLGERTRLALTLNSYASGWNASGQVPLREVSSGRMSRFGSIDPTEGGNSQRHSAMIRLTSGTDDGGEVSVMAYLTQYRLNIFSNFTFFSADPVRGDQIEQHDDRWVSGLAASYRFHKHLGSVSFDTTFGLQLRADSIDNALYRNLRRERLTTVIDARVLEGALGLYAQEDIHLLPWLRLVLAARADYFGFDVNDRLEDRTTLEGGTSGVRQSSQVSPKASLVFGAIPDTELYLNFGTGFHSNDARGIVRDVEPVTALTPAVGGELGARTRLFDRLDLAGAFFILDLASELVWVGDEGTTEARGPTRRLGIEAEARLKILDWLYADLDATWSRATYVQNAGNANAVALAPTFILGGGLSARHPIGIFGRVGGIYLANRPATEDRFIQAEGFFRVDGTLGYLHRWFEVSVAVQNLTNTQWREAQFANVSRLPNERSAADCPASTRAASDAAGNFLGCEDMHFTPGAPINLQASLSVFF
jgi:outer membrane receptor protein involved in Fe transport